MFGLLGLGFKVRGLGFEVEALGLRVLILVPEGSWYLQCCVWKASSNAAKMRFRV